MSNQWEGLPDNNYVLSDDNIGDALSYTKAAAKCFVVRHLDLQAWQYICRMKDKREIIFWIEWEYLDSKNNMSDLARTLLYALDKGS